MKWKLKTKIVAGTATVIGIALGSLERIYAPTYLVTEDPVYPDWPGWVGFILTAVAALAYMVIDLMGDAAGRR